MPATDDPLGHAHRLGPEIGAAAPAIDRDRRIPADLLASLHDARLFRMLLPRPFGGLETPPRIFLETIEAVARHDGSTAWCLCQANGCAMAAAYLDADIASEIWGGDPHAVLAWGPGRGRGEGGRGRLPRLGQTRLRERRTPRNLARRPHAGHRPGRGGPPHRIRRTHPAHPAVPRRQRRTRGHLGHDRTPGHGLRRLHARGPLRSGCLHHRARPCRPSSAPCGALPFREHEPLRNGFRRHRTRHRAGDVRCLRRTRAHQDPPPAQVDARRRSAGAVRTGPGRGQAEVGPGVPDHRGGRDLGERDRGGQA